MTRVKTVSTAAGRVRRFQSIVGRAAGRPREDELMYLVAAERGGLPRADDG